MDAEEVPVVGEIVIHVESVTDAVHDPPLHPVGPEVTVNVIDPPVAGTVLTEVGDAEN